MKYRQIVIIFFCAMMIFILSGCSNSQKLSKENTEDLKNSNEIIQLDVETIESQAGDYTFNISLTDFIESFNSHYNKDNDEILLTGLEDWEMYDVVLESNDDNVTTCYVFSEDVDIRALPQLKVNADNTMSGIRQISMCYDMHSYSPETYECYEELCYYALRTMVVDATDDEVKEYTSELLDALDESFTTDKTYYDNDPKYTWGPVGAYPYYVVGKTMELRLIPVSNK